MLEPPTRNTTTTTTSNRTDMDDIVQMKKQAARARIAEAQAATEKKASQTTEQKRKAANTALGDYRGKVQKHQQQWYKDNGYRWNQAEWQKAWARDGAAALTQLMPHLDAYDTAAQTELRLAAERGPGALEDKKKELLGRDKSGSQKDKILDGIVKGDFNIIAAESPALRTASQNYNAASAAWDKVKDNPNAAGYKEAKAAFLNAQGTYFTEWSRFVDEKFDKGLKDGQSPKQIGDDLKALFGEQMAPFIDLKVTSAQQKPKIDKWISDYRADPGKYNLTEAERKLFETDPTTVAVMKMSGVTLDPGTLSETEKKLAATSPVLFIQMKKAGVTFTDQIGDPTVMIGGKKIELTGDEKAAFKDGGIVGLAAALRNRKDLTLDKATQDLLLGSVPARLDATRKRVGELMAQGKDLEAMAFLKANMNAAMSPAERQALLMQAGMPHFGPGTDYWNKQIDRQLAAPDDEDPFTMANNGADKVGRWMQDVAKNAPAELVDIMLTTVKSRFKPDWVIGNGVRAPVGNDGAEFYKGLSVSVTIADQIAGNDRKGEFAKWLASAPVGQGSLVSLMLSENGEPIRLTIEGGFGTGLTDALMVELKGAPKQADGKSYKTAVVQFPGVIEKAKQNITEQQWLKVANEQYDAFEKNKGDMLQTYFDKFLNDPVIGTPLKAEDGPALRNLIGRALGLDPTQNHDQAKKNVTGVDWYGQNTDERKVIDLVAAWIISAGGSGATVTATPFVYADNNDGVAPGALFNVKRADDTQVIIDGSQADDAYRKAAGQGQKIDLKDPDENVYVDWKFDDFGHFIDSNDYQTDGRIYLLKDFTAAPGQKLDHATWDEHAAARTTGGERLKIVGDVVFTGAAIVGGILLTPFTGGTSLGVALTVGSMIWGAGRLIGEYSEARRNGVDFEWDNPMARDAIISSVSLGAGAISLGAGGLGSLVAVTGRFTGAATVFTAASRGTGVVAAGSGFYLTAKQINMVIEHGGEMSGGELALNLFFAGAGVVGMGTGFFSFRPRASGGAEPVDASIPGRAIVPLRDDGTEAGMPGGGGPRVRYVAHFDADGNPSLGLLGPDGRTTADVDAPWTGRHPSEVLVAEMVTGPDGRVRANAVHALVRNPDGTYTGVRWDLNGGTVRYTTGLPGANHPLEGIVLRNVRRSDEGDPAAGARPAGTSYRPFSPDPAKMRTPEAAETALRYSGLQLDSDWGLIVRHVDPRTRDIHVVEVNEGDLLFFDPATRQTFGRSRAEGFPLRFEDGARVYHPGTNREYVYSAARGRFEPLRAPADAELYFNPGANATFLRHADGTLELFARGNNIAKGDKTWEPTAADDGDRSPADWQFDRTTNRTYAPDDDGMLQPLDPEDLLTHYDSGRNVTYLVVPETGQVLFFGQGDNTDPNLAADPGRWQRAKQWAATRIGDKRLGGGGRIKLPGVPSTSTGATEASVGRGLGTKTGVSKPHKSDRWWEFKNAPLAFLFGFSNQEALQFKASTFRTHLQSILDGKGDKSPFTAAVAGFKEAGAHDADPSKTVVELSIVLTVKTKDAQLGEGEVNFFGSRGDVYELPHGIPFNKVMSEIKAGLPLWARAWIAAKYGDSAPDLLLLLGLGLRPGVESRPELSIKGIPEGAKVPEVFMLQVDAALSQTRIQLQVVTDNPAALARAIEADPSLENLRPYFDAGPTLIFVDRGPRSGMRLSSVTGDPARLRITDLTGRDRDVMNPSQMNLDVLFNKRRSMDYWLDRGVIWPMKRTFGNSRAGQRWSQTRFGRRAQPQPHFTPGEGIYAQFRDANRPAQRRATLSVTPLSIFGLLTGEIRAASKSPQRPDDLPKVLGERDANIAAWLHFEWEDGSVTSMAAPKWLADLATTASTGQGVVWPKGAKKALERPLELYESLAAGDPARTDALAALRQFRDEVLPTFKEGNYLSPKQAQALLDFLSTQA